MRKRQRQTDCPVITETAVRELAKSLSGICEICSEPPQLHREYCKPARRQKRVPCRKTGSLPEPRGKASIALNASILENAGTSRIRLFVISCLYLSIACQTLWANTSNVISNDRMLLVLAAPSSYDRRAMGRKYFDDVIRFHIDYAKKNHRP